MYNEPQPSLRLFTFYSQVMPGSGGTLIVAGSHRRLKHYFYSLPQTSVRQKQKTLKRRFTKSHPWLAELTGAVQGTGHRIQRFMEETTVIHDVAVRVVELTGEVDLMLIEAVAAGA